LKRHGSVADDHEGGNRESARKGREPVAARPAGR